MRATVSCPVPPTSPPARINLALHCHISNITAYPQVVTVWSALQANVSMSSGVKCMEWNHGGAYTCKPDATPERCCSAKAQ